MVSLRGVGRGGGEWDWRRKYRAERRRLRSTPASILA